MLRRFHAIYLLLLLVSATGFSALATASQVPPVGTTCDGYAQSGCVKHIAQFPDERAAIGAGANSVKFLSQPGRCWDLTILFT